MWLERGVFASYDLSCTSIWIIVTNCSLKWWLIPLLPPSQLLSTTVSGNTIFLPAWKNARIRPIPKVDQPKSEEHFRPISILPTLSKVFEKLVALQMTTFWESESVLRDTISSFRKGHSTNTVLMGMRDDSLRAMKKGEVTLMVLYRSMIVHLNQWTYVSVYHKGRSSAQSYLISTFPISKIISLPRLVHFNTLTILQYTPAVQLLSYIHVRKN